LPIYDERYAGSLMSTVWAKKVRPPTAHGHNSVKVQPIFKCFSGRYLDEFAIKFLLTILPHLACVATLTCETFM